MDLEVQEKTNMSDVARLHIPEIKELLNKNYSCSRVAAILQSREIEVCAGIVNKVKIGKLYDKKN